jgi:Ni,Fe-hydrogenase maturation factor
MARFAIISFDRHPATSTHIAQRVTQRLDRFNLQNLSIIDVDDLTPELAGQLARVDYAVFINSPSTGGQVDVKVRAIGVYGSEPAGSTMPTSGHSCTPSSLLALTQSAYGRHPQAWSMQIYIPKGTSSVDMEAVLDQATREVEGLIRNVSRCDSKHASENA